MANAPHYRDASDTGNTPEDRGTPVPIIAPPALLRTATDRLRALLTAVGWDKPVLKKDMEDLRYDLLSLCLADGAYALGNIQDVAKYDEKQCDRFVRGVIQKVSLEDTAIVTPAMAEQLVSLPVPHYFEFRKLSILSEKAARILARGKGVTLPLRVITPAVAAAFAEHASILRIADAQELSLETATALAKHVGTLKLENLTDLHVDIAHALAAKEGNLTFLDLPSLTPEVAKILATFKGTLSFGKMTTLPIDVARELASHYGVLEFSEIERLDDVDVARVLSQHKNIVRLPCLVTVSDDVARVMAPNMRAFDVPAPLSAHIRTFRSAY